MRLSFGAATRAGAALMAAATVASPVQAQVYTLRVPLIFSLTVLAQ